MTDVFPTWVLRRCTECGQKLPDDWDWDVRSLTWLHDLPRRISPSNNDLSIHDGADGRNRFLHLEFKRDGRAMSDGQARHIAGLSMFDRHGVLVVIGKRVDRVTVQPVLRGEFGDRYQTTAESLNEAIIAWLRGHAWRDASERLFAQATDPRAPDGQPGHMHGWAKVDGGWRCIQDFYAAGFKPDTACDATWEPVT